MRPSPIPSARVVRQAGATIAPPREPLLPQLARIGEPLRLAAGYSIAFAPLTVVLLACAGMLWAVGYNAGP